MSNSKKKFGLLEDPEKRAAKRARQKAAGYKAPSPFEKQAAVNTHATNPKARNKARHGERKQEQGR
jgi:hypothetical protein